MYNTAQDVVYYLLAATGGGAQDGEHIAIRQAVVHGVREVMQCRNWNWHTRSSSFVVQPVSATMSYWDGKTVYFPLLQAGYPFAPDVPVYVWWPQAVQQSLAQPFPEGTVYVKRGIGTDAYSIELSNNAVRSHYPPGAAPNNNPTMGDTGAQLRQNVSTFLLPKDIKDIDALVSHTAGTLHSYITPEEWLRLNVNLSGTSEPYHYTIMRSEADRNRWEVRFAGVPTQGLTFHYTYRYTPEPIRYMGYEPRSRSGTATVSNTTSITITPALPTAAQVDIVGRVIRFGTETDYPEPVGSTTPFLREREIIRVSGGKPEVDLILTPRTNVKYCITDIIDCSPSMYTAILSACEMWYARIAGKPSADAMATFNRDLRIAMENDTLAPMSGRPGDSPYPTPRSMGWHSNLLPDVS